MAKSNDFSGRPVSSRNRNKNKNMNLQNKARERVIAKQERKRRVEPVVEEVDVEASFSTMTGVAQNKTLTLSNGHPTGTETGFASPLLLAILTATIEITTLLYIFLNEME